MTTAAVPALGTRFLIGDGATPEVFSVIAEVTNLTGPSLKLDTIDATSHDSTDGWREFIGGLKSATVNFELNFLPADAGQTGLIDKLAAKSKHNFRCIFPVFNDTGFAATVNAGTDIWTATAHGLYTGQPVRLTNSGGALPASNPQIVAGNTYYAGREGDNTFMLYATNAAAVAGSGEIDFSGAGTGTHTVHIGWPWSFTAEVVSIEPQAPVDGLLKARLTLQITGSTSATVTP